MITQRLLQDLNDALAQMERVKNKNVIQQPTKKNPRSNAV